MSIRVKCALLLVAFEAILAFTIIFTVRYIGAYFEDAADSFSHSRNRIEDIYHLRNLLRNELSQLTQLTPQAAAKFDSVRLSRQIYTATDALIQSLDPEIDRDLRSALGEKLLAREAAVSTYVRQSPDSAAAPFDPEPHRAIDALLTRVESQVWSDVRATVDRTFQAQGNAILFLSANMFVGAALGILGLILARRWVLLPVAELQRAVDELGKGRLSYRAKVLSDDELGRLALAFNKMSADLWRIEGQMLKKERLAAMGELISYVAHNIRNPLAGIRSSAEASRRVAPEDSPVATQQENIIRAVDEFQRWLRQLEHTCSPLELHTEPTDLDALIEHVIAVFQPMVERRSIEIRRARAANGEPPAPPVLVDGRHFEQALAAILGNAIEAVPDGGRVTIAKDPALDPAQWSLSIADTGPGIPADVRHRIFEPTYSTKRTGHGLGLALAKKVIEMHGGQLSCECPDEGGTIFRVTLPVNPEERLSHA